MSRDIIKAGVLLCFFLSQVTFGQEQGRSTPLKQVLVFRHDQDAIRGKLIEIREEDIVVLSTEREVIVPFAEISRIILTHEKGPGSGAIYGGVLGGYASASLYTLSRDQGGFVESRDMAWYLLVVLPSIALGAGIGYLVDPGFAEEEEVFDFTGSDEAKAGERVRLAAAATPTAGEGKVHITFQGSHVYSSMPNLALPNSYTSFDNNSTSKFRLLRRVQATYSVEPEVEVGVALVWFSEPPQSSFGYEAISSTDNVSYNASQSCEGSGKYVVVLYNPLYHLVDPRLDIKVGGGVGIASIAYSRTTAVWTYPQSGSGTLQNSVFNVSENVLVGYLLVQLEFQIADGLSLGLVADRVFAPSRDAPAVPEARIPPQALRFGNTSVGFTISLHF